MIINIKKPHNYKYNVIINNNIAHINQISFI